MKILRFNSFGFRVFHMKMDLVNYRDSEKVNRQKVVFDKNVEDFRFNLKRGLEDLCLWH